MVSRHVKICKKFVDSGVTCKASKGPSGAQQVRLHSIPKPPIPWHTLHLDLTGKLSSSPWQHQLGDIQLALNNTRCSITGFTPLELMFGIQGNSLKLPKINDPSHDTVRLDPNTARSNASNNIQKWSKSDTLRFNRGIARIRPFSVSDFVFVKSEERHQTKLDRKYKGLFKITPVLENDRYELRHVNGSNRVYKFSNENLRQVPHDSLALIEIANYSNEDVTADSNDNNALIHENDHDIDITFANSDTVSADSRTLTAESENTNLVVLVLCQ